MSPSIRMAELESANRQLEDSRLAALNMMEDAIASRRRAEQAIAELGRSEARFRALVENAPDAIVVLDVEKMVFIDCNQKACDLYGLSREELLAKGPVELSPPFQPDGRPSGESTLEKLQQAAAGDSPRFEWFHRNMRGEEIPCEISLTRLPSATGTFIRASMVDISERKRIEEVQMFLAQAGYQESRETFFEALARLLSRCLGMGYVCIDRLHSDNLSAQTLAVYNDGRFEANVAYALKDTPCGDVVGKHICCFPRGVCQRFPQDAALQDLHAESYVGTTLWGSSGKPIGLIAVIGHQPLANPKLAETILKLVAVRAAGELERQQIEETLRISEERFRNLVQSVPTLAVQGYGMDGVTKYWNQASERLYGYTEQEAIGRNLLDLIIPPEMREYASQAIRQMSETGQPIPAAELSLMRKDGSRVAVFSSHAIVQVPGRPMELFCLDSDITERQRAEAALRESELQYRILADSGQALIWTSGLDKKCNYFNQPWLAFTGRTLEQEMGDGWTEGVHPDDLARCVEIYTTAFDRRERFSMDYRIRHRDGSWRWIQDDGSPRYDTHGDFVGYIGHCLDITDRKQADAVLRESEGKYRSLIEASPIPYALNDNQQRILYLNAAFVRTFGYTREDIPVLSEWWPKAYPDPEYRQWVATTWQEHLETARRTGTEFEPMELEIRDKEGKSHIVLASAASMDGVSNNEHLVILYDITERKRAELALRESEERYRSILNASPDDITITDLQGRVLMVSPVALTMFGYGPEELQKELRLTDFIVPEDRDRAMANFAQVLQGAQAGPNEYRGLRADGSVFDIEVNSQFIRGADGNPVQMVLIVRDITERKRVEAEATQAQLLTKAIIDSIPGTFYALDENGRYRRWNAYQRDEIVGKPEDQIAGMDAAETIHPEDRALVQSRIANVLANGVDEIVEGRVLLRGGPDFRWLLMTGRRILIEGKPLLVGIGIDITSRKQAEEELQRRQSYLAAIIENQPGLVWLKDVESRFLAVNQAFAASCGRQSAEEVAGRTDVDVWPAELAEKYRQDDLMVIEKGTAIITEEFIRTEDETRWFETYKTAVVSPQGKIIGTTGYAHDITSRKQAETELRQHREHLEELVQKRTAELAEARDQAQAANKAKSVFLANMSHELRTPLTAVLGFSEIMSRDPTMPGRSKETLAIIMRSGEHLLALINDILDLSKIDAGRAEVSLRDVDLGELVRDVINMMRVRAEAKGLRLILDQSSEFPRFANTDPGKFRQILVNLVGNAIKFTDHGQVTIKLGAQATADGQMLDVEVRDSGIGIAAGDLSRIFQPFEQIGTRMTEGTGLCLAITRQYVQMLGGQIQVDSEPGQGSRFRFTIPVGSVSLAGAAGTLPAGRYPVRVIGPSADLRILIVEDQPENRLLIRRFLEPLNLQLREAPNGQSAVTIFQAWRPQLIFMDRRMPVLDGLEATRRIRALPSGGDVVIIAVSAHSFKEEQREMLAAGCNGFLGKPFGADEFLSLLKQQLHLEFVYEEK